MQGGSGGENINHMFFECCEEEMEWAFTEVDCRLRGEEKKRLWEDLDSCSRRWGRNWVVRENYNMILKKGERSGNNSRVSQIEEFTEAVNSLNLVDLPLKGGQWTWSNMRCNPSCSRIYRFFISHNFLLKIAGAKQSVLEKPISDHFPICLSSDGIKWRPIPFRFDNK